MSLERKDSWSDLTISGLQTYLKSLIFRIPALERRVKYECAYGKTPGTDVEVSMTDRTGSEHLPLFEIEQYASGTGLNEKVKKWAHRHHAKPNTTTVVVSLVLQALRNRLTAEFSHDKETYDMVFSPKFRIFPGTGDGTIAEELKRFIDQWIELKL